MLKFTNKKVISVQDWDDLVQKTYGRPYSFQQQDGCKSRGNFDFSIPSDDYESDFGNDTLPEKVNHEEMGASFAAWLARDPKQPLKDEEDDGSVQWMIDLWWARNFYPSFDMVAKDLYEKGLIPEGKYTIDIDW
jgi:hypothetical protein